MGIFDLEKEVHPRQFRIFLLTLCEALWWHHEAFPTQCFNAAGSRIAQQRPNRETFNTPKAPPDFWRCLPFASPRPRLCRLHFHRASDRIIAGTLKPQKSSAGQETAQCCRNRINNSVSGAPPGRSGWTGEAKCQVGVRLALSRCSTGPGKNITKQTRQSGSCITLPFPSATLSARSTLEGIFFSNDALISMAAGVSVAEKMFRWLSARREAQGRRSAGLGKRPPARRAQGWCGTSGPPPSSGFLQERARPSCTSSTRRFPPLTADECFLLLAS